MPAPKALVISNFPILAQTVEFAFRGRYDVVTTLWAAPEQFAAMDAELIVLDITIVGREAARQLFSRIPPGTRAAICSLHRNEVDVYWIGDDGPSAEGELPSLLFLPSPSPRAGTSSLPAQPT